MLRTTLAAALLLASLYGRAASQGAPRASASPAPAASVTIRLATFNIRQLGPTKAARQPVMETLADVIAKYDLVAVQEIKDRRGRVALQLLELIRRRDARFAVIVSPRTGRQADDRRSQEQYAYYYRKDRLVPVGEHGLFDDSAHDHFQREPHVASFAAHGACADLVLLNLHTPPRAAMRELIALEHVFRWAVATFGGRRHFIALGDFNAGCGYASEDDLDALPIHGEAYDWVIPHSADTNLASSRCAYDRIVVRSPRGNLLVADWGVDRAFADAAVSDHWPVWAAFDLPACAR